MKVLLLSLTLFISIQLSLAQIPILGPTVEEYKQPLQFYGHLDVNGLLPLSLTPSPNDAAFDIKYWLNETPNLESSFGFGWQMGFNEGYADSSFDFSIEDVTGNELAYLYNYLSLRYKWMKGAKKIRPYAEFGGGWLLVSHQFVDRPLNPKYDPDHTCPDGPNEFLRNTTPIRTQNRIALDAEVGVNFALTDKVSLNVGVGGIVTNKVAQLEEAYHPSVLENVNRTPQKYQFNNHFLQAPSLKLGLSFVLFSDPNEERKDCCCDCNTDYYSVSSSSSSCN